MWAKRTCQPAYQALQPTNCQPATHAPSQVLLSSLWVMLHRPSTATATHNQPTASPQPMPAHKTHSHSHVFLSSLWVMLHRPSTAVTVPRYGRALPHRLAPALCSAAPSSSTPWSARGKGW